MKHRLILFALLIFFVCTAKAQNLINGRYLPEPMIKPGSNPPSYGYVIYEDIKGEGRKPKLVIDYQYDEGYPFSMPSGLARVKKNGKYGFITTTNVVMVPIRFEWADNFNEKGFCRVKLDGKFGVIDSKGAFVVPNIYDTMDDLLNGWYEVSRDGEWGYVHRSNIYTSDTEEYHRDCRLIPSL